jgi:hypothetical protein
LPIILSSVAQGHSLAYVLSDFPPVAAHDFSRISEILIPLHFYSKTTGMEIAHKEIKGVTG